MWKDTQQKLLAVQATDKTIEKTKRYIRKHSYPLIIKKTKKIKKLMKDTDTYIYRRKNRN